MSGKVTHGADVEQLDDIAVGLRRQGTKIADVGGRGAAQLEKLRALWDGPDFEKFAKEWRAAHRFIDDAESAIRTYSRKLLVEADQQRQSSTTSSAPAVTSGLERPRSGFTREDGGELVRSGREQVFARTDAEPTVHESGRSRVEQLPQGLTGLTLDGPDGPLLLASPEGMLVTGDRMVALPGLPGAEEIGVVEPPGFERMDIGPAPAERAGPEGPGPSPGGDPPSPPVQVPTGEGGHLTTASDAAGQVSVAFDPRGILPEAGRADPSPVSGWLRVRTGTASPPGS